MVDFVLHSLLNNSNCHLTEDIIAFFTNEMNYPFVSAKAVRIGSGVFVAFDTQTPSRGGFPLTIFFMTAAAHAITTINGYRRPPNSTITINVVAFMPSSNTMIMALSSVDPFPKSSRKIKSSKIPS